MKKTAFIFLIAFGLFLINISFNVLLPYPFKADLVLTYILLLSSIEERAFLVYLIAFLFGILNDAISGLPLGIGALSYTLGVFVQRRTAMKLLPFSELALYLSVFLGSLVSATLVSFGFLIKSGTFPYPYIIAIPTASLIASFPLSRYIKDVFTPPKPL